ncbi:diguanylate cyclase [compost metagenome]
MIGHPKIQVSVSIGLKEYEAGLSKDEFFKNADDSMYLAKASGKNRTICTECQPSLVKEKD